MLEVVGGKINFSAHDLFVTIRKSSYEDNYKIVLVWLLLIRQKIERLTVEVS